MGWTHLSWQNSERREVRVEVHIALGYACKPFEGRAIKPFTVRNTISELLHRNSDTFRDANNISKFQIYIVHMLSLKRRQDLVLCHMVLPSCHNQMFLSIGPSKV